jgi:ssRNA-specific RNase YbeY (16S rRNA maturation enzyme)
VIHLVGYDHEISLKEEKIMEAWDEKMLKLFSKAKKKGA